VEALPNVGSEFMTDPSTPDHAHLAELLVQSATDYAIFSTDRHGTVTSWNIGAERLLGYCEAEILGHTADVIFTPEQRAAGTPGLERAQAAAHGRAEDDRWQVRKDGSRFFASGLLMPLANPEAGFVKILRDRTQQHESALKLVETEERFRLLAANIPQLVFISRPDGDRTWGSPQWIEFTGFSLARSVGFGWLDAVHPDDREETLRAWQDAQTTGEYYVQHRVLRSRDGEYRWHQTRARPLTKAPGASGAGDLAEWVGTMTDVHDLVDMQNRQRVLMAELQHRTRNLLAVTQAIAQQTLQASDSLESFAEVFESRLQALSRVQALLAQVDQSVIDLRDLVTAELAAHADLDDGVGQRVRVEGPSVPLPANSAQALGLALHELATNAVKYGALANDAGRLTVAWQLEGAAPARWVGLTWREEGVSLPPGEMPRRKGYGRELIEEALPYQLGARTEFSFAPDGVRCAIKVPLQNRSSDA
jgi:PAS domain S-box-containing protein